MKNTTQRSAFIPFTKEGLQHIERERDDLLAQRPAVVSELTRARELGDLSENGAYRGAKMKLADIDRRLRHLAHVLRHAVVVEKQTVDTIEIGSRVVVDDGQNKRAFLIVGGYESNPLEGKISHLSPLGKLLLGKKTGEKVVMNLPSSITTYTILSVN